MVIMYILLIYNYVSNYANVSNCKCNCTFYMVQVDLRVVSLVNGKLECNCWRRQVSEECDKLLNEADSLGYSVELQGKPPYCNVFMKQRQKPVVKITMRYQEIIPWHCVSSQSTCTNILYIPSCTPMQALHGIDPSTLGEKIHSAGLSSLASICFAPENKKKWKCGKHDSESLIVTETCGIHLLLVGFKGVKYGNIGKRFSGPQCILLCLGLIAPLAAHTYVLGSSHTELYDQDDSGDEISLELKVCNVKQIQSPFFLPFQSSRPSYMPLRSFIYLFFLWCIFIVSKSQHWAISDGYQSDTWLVISRKLCWLTSTGIWTRIHLIAEAIRVKW